MPIKQVENTSHYIGTLNEKSLHADLKKWYARAGDQLEVPLDGYYIDIVRDDTLIEIQTRNFSSIKKKLLHLVESHPVRLVHAIAEEKWIVKLPQKQGGKQTRRKSPKHGCITDILDELVRFPSLMKHNNFSLEIILIKEEEVRIYDSRRSWRRHGWITQERKLLEVNSNIVFEKPEDFCSLLPDDLPAEFTTEDIANVLGTSRRIVQKMTYCLKKMDVIQKIGTKNRFYLYKKV